MEEKLKELEEHPKASRKQWLTLILFLITVCLIIAAVTWIFEGLLA